MKNIELYNKIKEFIDDMNDYDLVIIHNEYCHSRNNFNDEILNDYDFNELNEYTKPIDIAYQIFYGDFNPNDIYWWYDGYGNFESGDVRERIYTSEIANYVIDNNCDLGNVGIRAILNEYEAEEN